MTQGPAILEVNGAAFTKGCLAIIAEGNVVAIRVISTGHRPGPRFQMVEQGRQKVSVRVRLSASDKGESLQVASQPVQRPASSRQIAAGNKSNGQFVQVVQIVETVQIVEVVETVKIVHSSTGQIVD